MRYAYLVPDHQQSAIERLVPRKSMAVLKARSRTKTATDAGHTA